MGQKTHPHGFRLGFNKQWSSRWFSKGTEYGRLIHEDLRMKKAIKEKYYHAGISEVVIERVGPKKLRSAVVDPENKITLEINRVNNGRRLESDGRLAASWTSRWIFWLQNVLAGGGL